MLKNGESDQSNLDDMLIKPLGTIYLFILPMLSDMTIDITHAVEKDEFSGTFEHIVQTRMVYGGFGHVAFQTSIYYC